MSAGPGQRGAGWWLAVAGSVVVVASLVAAIGVMGTPGQQRLARLDARRVEDLGDLARAIDAYHASRRKLPHSLVELRQLPGQALAIVDPVSGTPYRYEPRKGDRYRLCATFATDSGRIRTGRWSPESWRHGEGEQCFDLPSDQDGAAALKQMRFD